MDRMASLLCAGLPAYTRPTRGRPCACAVRRATATSVHESLHCATGGDAPARLVAGDGSASATRSLPSRPATHPGAGVVCLGCNGLLRSLGLPRAPFQRSRARAKSALAWEMRSETLRASSFSSATANAFAMHAAASSGWFRCAWMASDGVPIERDGGVGAP